uniref:Heme haloperoxidase family profile domain-containing protein n=1 Tax=Globisporangium ultimum (strain ATCC 200006 / CBS 805.95 / DAOM BR144) TaxID=431595 RepID=K3WVQ7_GLOUD
MQPAGHEYFRPPRSETSGVPNSPAQYHRSPCPCLNTLANHGYLPRDGKNLTPQMLKHAVCNAFNLDPSLAKTLVAPLPHEFTLADLGKHNFLEHDASLVHDDAFFQSDPTEINVSLADELFSRAVADSGGGETDTTRVITPRVLAQYRADREQDCKQRDPEYTFDRKRQLTAYAESSALLLGMGDYTTETISVAHAHSFLVDEKFPDDFIRSTKTITKWKATWLAVKLKLMARFPRNSP